MSFRHSSHEPNCTYYSTHPEYNDANITSGIHIFDFEKNVMKVSVVAYAVQKCYDGKEISFINIYIGIGFPSSRILDARIFKQDANFSILRQATKDKNEQVILDYILPKCNLDMLLDLVIKEGVKIGRRLMQNDLQNLLGL